MTRCGKMRSIQNMIGRCHNRKPTAILSWNINDTSDKNLGDKTFTPEFADLIEKCRIFCLQETKREVQVPEYKCYNQNRNNSRSGGVCIGVHRSIEKHVKQLKTGDPDICAISLSKKYTDMEKDLMIINIYDSPENS
jgi:exonuclease III